MAEVYHALGLHMHQPPGNLVALHIPILPPGFGVRQPSGAFGFDQMPKRQRAAAVQNATAFKPEQVEAAPTLPEAKLAEDAP